jgi:hypothetical protein
MLMNKMSLKARILKMFIFRVTVVLYRVKPHLHL